MKKAKTVDDYIENVPSNFKKQLEDLRKVIIQVAPKAEERISYGIPYYDYKGRLVYFALAKNHIGFYIPPPIIENFKNELNEYKTTVSAIHFPLDKSLPIGLIKKLIKARIEWNKKINK